MSDQIVDTTGDNPKPQWRALDSEQRRVLGVLIEKSKTTPDSYPLTLNALTNGCNQKSNRSPQMNLASDDLLIVLDALRDMEATVEFHSAGRTAKYKHTMYQWMGVDKKELAVMGELLLRGEQTIGELRGRAARMEPIAGVAELRPILQALISRKLVVELTPSGRGQIVTHGLYLEKEMEELRKEHGGFVASDTASEAASSDGSVAGSISNPAPTGGMLNPATPAQDSAARKNEHSESDNFRLNPDDQIADSQTEVNSVGRRELETLREQIEDLNSFVQEMQKSVEDLERRLDRIEG